VNLTPLASELAMSASTLALACRTAPLSAKSAFHAEVGGHRDEVIPCELHRPCHQLVVRGPERLRRLRQLLELGSPKREAVIGEPPAGRRRRHGRRVGRALPMCSLAALQCGYA